LWERAGYARRFKWWPIGICIGATPGRLGAPSAHPLLWRALLFLAPTEPMNAPLSDRSGPAAVNLYMREVSCGRSGVSGKKGTSDYKCAHSYKAARANAHEHTRPTEGASGIDSYRHPVDSIASTRQERIPAPDKSESLRLRRVVEGLPDYGDVNRQADAAGAD